MTKCSDFPGPILALNNQFISVCPKSERFVLCWDPTYHQYLMEILFLLQNRKESSDPYTCSLQAMVQWWPIKQCIISKTVYKGLKVAWRAIAWRSTPSWLWHFILSPEPILTQGRNDRPWPASFSLGINEPLTGQICIGHVQLVCPSGQIWVTILMGHAHLVASSCFMPQSKSVAGVDHFNWPFWQRRWGSLLISFTEAGFGSVRLSIRLYVLSWLNMQTDCMCSPGWTCKQTNR